MINSEHIGTFVRTKYRRFKTESNGCYICWKNFGEVDELKSHLKLHSNSVVVKDFNASWKSVKSEEAIQCIFELVAARIIFNLSNTSNVDVTIQFIGVYNENFQFGRLNLNEFPLFLRSGENITLRSPALGLNEYNHYIIVYEESDQKHFEKIQSYIVELKITEIRLTCAEEEVTEENQTASLPLTDVGARRIHDILKIIPLPWYEPNDDVKELCVASFQSPSSKFHPFLPHNSAFNLINEFKGLSSANYVEILSHVIQIEDFTARLAIMNSAKHNRELEKRGPGEYALKLTPQEGRPLFLIKGDTFWLGTQDSDTRLRGYVKKVSSVEILLKLRFNGVLQALPIYSIHFEVNRLTFQMERKALDDAKDLNVIPLLFPSEHHKLRNEELTLPKLQFFDPKIKSDVNQIAAVKHIVEGTAYPLPYLLLGFPGTGKTKVIVESICQLFSFPKNRILVCSSSNNVCDEIAQKLIPLLKSTTQHQTSLTQQYNILRLYATSVRRSCKNYELLDNSNFDEKSIPCLAEIYKYRIVVCTLTVAGRLAQGNISKDHFTHLFIDECESAAETYTLIPIVGICSSSNSINANIILSGDPLQLGPIVRSNISKNMQLSEEIDDDVVSLYKLTCFLLAGVSMFQRLYRSDPYRKDSRTKEYNQRYISKLKNNYRSHPKLVALPNKLFYNHEIRSSANPVHFKWYSELQFLKYPGFPIVFENIDGAPNRKMNCVSWYNHEEANCIMKFIKQLLENRPKRIYETDIGVISPYKRQCIDIEDRLEAENYNEIEVGSVEQFQGKEKPIIIISTVRKEGMGFMQERERINVMITRAIGLLIIIGHRETLLKNPDWRKIIDYAEANCDIEEQNGQNEVQEELSQ
ncbi:putative helicase mov-10-B.2 [Pseudolycoriella hygida]|uniref:Helicase mov-10-B.2 n=1 Tax=Pseudolycoriella hygida TaxID=35572 RepID=A0A9Q0NFN1_9DIPT|nr:putative helicase mov-10-B.2 [Pseudolycoriella hygida]